jgi:hypothetical protein
VHRGRSFQNSCGKSPRYSDGDLAGHKIGAAMAILCQLPLHERSQGTRSVQDGGVQLLGIINNLAQEGVLALFL